MMKASNFFILIAFSFASALILFSFKDIKVDMSNSSPALVVDGPEEFTEGHPKEVNFEFTEFALSEMSERDKQEQIRDWVLLAVIKGNNLDKSKLSDIVFDIPPIRYEYLQPVSNLSYGETRYRMIADDTGIAIIPTGEKNAQFDHLCNIADALRKDIGKIPSKLKVYTYEIDKQNNKAIVTKQKEVKGESLFNAQAGYYEVELNDLSDLQDFMSKAQDITYVKYEYGGLTVGGRSLKSRRYSNIKVEDVAAIWQSEENVQSKLSAFEAKWDNVTYDPSEIGAEERLTAEMLEEQKELGVVSASGFSLDPVYEYHKISETLNEIDFFWGETPVWSTYSASLKEAVRRKDEERVFAILQEISNQDQDFAKFLLEIAFTENRVQKARYDGYLQGTEVGMHLFYTDLIAKIWANNMFYSAPSKAVPEFMHNLNTELSKVYKKEAEQFSESRLWFGKDDDGIQIGKDNDEILFERKSTRIFEASSDPLYPGQETPETAFWSKSLNWWNNHYDEIAAYEPEYEYLNEIVKWSVIVSWLYDKDRGSLGFLNGVTVNRSHWFPTWAKRNPKLKFNQWSKIEFKPRGYQGIQQEVMPILVSPMSSVNGLFISGGVSLAGKTEIKAMSALADDISPIARRSFLKYEEGMVSVRGLKVEINNVARTNRINLIPQQGVKLRSNFAEVKNVPFLKEIRANEDALHFTIKHQDVAIGELNISKNFKNGFDVGFKSMETDQAMSLGQKMSNSNNIPKLLESTPSVKSFKKVAENSYEIEFNGGSSIAQMEVNTQTGVELSGELASRIAGTSPNSKIIYLKWKPGVDRGQRPLADHPLMKEYVEGDMQGFSRKLANASTDPISLKKVVEADYRQKLNQFKELVKNQQRETARELLDNMLLDFGNRPELVIRKALLPIDHTIANIGRESFSTLKGVLNQTNPSNLSPKLRSRFLQEASNRIQAADISKQMKNALFDYAVHGAKSSKRPCVFINDLKACKNLHEFEKVKWSDLKGKVKNQTFRIDEELVANNPEFSNLDYYADFNVVMSRLIEVFPDAIIYKVPRQKLRHFRLQLVGESAEKVKVKLEYRGSSGGLGNDDDDEEEEEEEEGEEDAVYLVKKN